MPQTKPSGSACLPDTLGFERHDHRHCAKAAITAAEAHCASENLRFTPVRRKTLEILLQQHRALGAYEILEKLQAAGFGSQPPVAYRALDFLVDNALVHKIERLNAFIACTQPIGQHSPAFLICRVCHSVSEAASAPALGDLAKAALDIGFRIERTVVEVEGVCPACTPEIVA